MENNNVRYQQSIAAEFSALKDRVKFFIENRHNGEEGRFKEIILMNFLKRVLPDNVGVGTGFVKNENGDISTQIDIIVYKKHDPKFFSEGDFVILMPDSVLGIIEVKSKVTPQVLCGRSRFGHDVMSTIDKCHYNGEIIGNRNIFNGIFSFDKNMSFNNRIHSVEFINQIKQKNGYLNHICFDDSIFMRYWAEGNPMDYHPNDTSSYSIYDLSYEKIFRDDRSKLPGLAYGYFISNLIETVYSFVSPNVLNRQYFEFLYPLRNTKEAYRLENCEIIITRFPSDNTPF